MYEIKCLLNFIKIKLPSKLKIIVKIKKKFFEKLILN